VSGVRTLRLSH